MPLNRTYPLDALFAACADYVAARRRKLLFEYVVLAGVNDGEDQVAALARRLERPLYHLNLIAYNETAASSRGPSRAGSPPSATSWSGWESSTTVRDSPGGEIEAACGQLARRRDAAAPGGTQ